MAELTVIKELTLLAIAILTLAGIVGSVTFFVLRTKFVTTDTCKVYQHECHERVCGKIHELKANLQGLSITQNINQELINRRNVWLASAISKIAAKLDIDLTDMPTGGRSVD